MNTPSDDHTDLELLIRFLSKEANVQEQHEVNQWIESHKKNRKYFDELLTLWNASATAGNFNTALLNEDWKKVYGRIETLRTKESVRPAKQRSLVYRFAQMAATIIFCVGFYFVIQAIYKNAFPNEVIAASTNEMVTVTLEDGSTVYLNLKSKLIYPEKFTGRERAVSLEGEAFFEIVKDSKKPFVIATGEVLTEVVGTSFSVDSKANQVLVTVVTGKVLVHKDQHNAVTLTVGEQAIYTGGQLKKQFNVDLNFLSWKTKILEFQNTPLPKVVEDLNRHYGQRLQLESNALAGCTLNSRYENQSLEDILQELKLLFSVQIEKTGNVIVIKGKGC